MFHVEHFALRTDVPRGTLSQSLRLTGLPLQAAQRQLLPADFLQHTDRDVFGHDQRFHRDDECLFHRKLAEACGVGDAVGVDQPRRHRRKFELRYLFRFGSHRRLWSFRSYLPQKKLLKYPRSRINGLQIELPDVSSWPSRKASFRKISGKM